MRPADEHAFAMSRLAFEQAAAALSQQQQVLDTLRSRAGTLLSGAAISTSFLGGQAVVSGPLRPTTWIAIVCFVIVGMTSTAIMWPRLEIETSTRPVAIGATYPDEPRGQTIASMLLVLAEHLRFSYARNEPHVARIATYLRVGTVFMTFEVIWWVADLALRS